MTAARMPGLHKYLHDDFIKTARPDAISQIRSKRFILGVFVRQGAFRVLSDNITNAMIFSHHPVNWDIEHHNGTYPSEKYLQELRDRNIFIYVLHHPLDNYGEY